MEPISLAEALEEVYREGREIDGPLSDRLKHVQAAVVRLSPAFDDKVEEFVGRLKAAEAGSSAPAIGEVLPRFLLPDTTGRVFPLEELLETGPLAVVFHRGHWCPYCRLSTAALEETREQLSALGGRIVSITPEPQKFARAMSAETGATFPILSDYDNGYALSLGLAVWVEASMAAMIAKAGWDVPVFQGNQSWLLPIPAAFVVDRKGVIVARHTDADYRRRMPMEAILGAMKNLV